MGGNVGAQHGIDLVFGGFQVACVGYARQAQRQCGMQQRRDARASACASGAVLLPESPRAALVLDNTRQVEEIHGRCVGMHFDLKSASFPDAHFRAVGKAQVPEPPTERQDVLSKGRPRLAAWHPA
jgi:hypothetical protein